MAVATCGAGKYNMGLHRIGDPGVEFKRKFRYLLQVQYCIGQGNPADHTVPPYFVKTAGRPDLTIEETELNFLNSKTWIAGKPSWETMSVTYMDVDTGDNVALWAWIGTIYNFFTTGNGVGNNANQPCYSMGRRSQYEGQATLQMLDACGGVTEQFVYNNFWPTSIKFGELDYSSSETVDIEMTCRYSNVAYTNVCGNQPIPCTCTPCPPKAPIAFL